jgi:hypothetical protein
VRASVIAHAAVALNPRRVDISVMTDAEPTATVELRRLDAYAGLPAVASFAHLTNPAVYTALPDDWVLGLADIVQSTEAIAQGRYKAVNTAGAAVIAAVANNLGTQQFPFVFGGDGASFALPGEHEALARAALASVAAWIQDDLHLEMRVALVPVAAIRAAGHDVRIAHYAPSAQVSYAMFTGGGLRYADAEMKRGAYAVAPGPPGSRPDLTGLSCRFAEIGATRGVILSLITVPGPSASPAAFAALVQSLLDLAEGGEAGRPVPDEGPEPVWPSAGLEFEARATRKPTGSLAAARARVVLRALASFLIFKTGWRLGGFDPIRYRRQLVENTDFRKFDDGLRMTLDCTPALADRIETLLAAAEAEGIACTGTHRQTAALMTCFVPSARQGDHIHFIDGAMGGYAAAARALKRT